MSMKIKKCILDLSLEQYIETLPEEEKRYYKSLPTGKDDRDDYCEDGQHNKLVNKMLKVAARNKWNVLTIFKNALYVQCQCGHKFRYGPEEHSKQKFCKECFKKKHNQQIDAMIGRWNDKQYVPLPLKCDKGHRFEASLRQLKYDYECLECYKEQLVSKLYDLKFRLDTTPMQ